MGDLVSIIIPVYNAEKYIEETVQSVISQDWSNWELIMVNDGSTDNSASICANLEKTDTRISFVSHENQGVAGARNTGFDISKGDFISFLDADDVWMVDNLSLKMKKFERGHFGLVHSDAETINAESESLGEVISGKEGDLLEDYLLWNGSCIPGPSSVVIRREVLQEVGLFDEKLSTSADQDLFIRISSKYTVGRVPKPTWQYRIHDANMHKGIQRMEKDVLRVFEKVNEAGLFPSKKFKRRSMGVTFRILGASWMGDGGSFFRGLLFLFRSLMVYPKGVRYLFERVNRKMK